MTRSRKPAVAAVSLVSSAAVIDDIVQIKIWLLGIRPMVRRRVLVPAKFSLRELHGVLQISDGLGIPLSLPVFTACGPVWLIGAVGIVARHLLTRAAL